MISRGRICFLMAFTNKGTLKTAISAWQAREDSAVTCNADDQITLDKD